MLQKHVCTNLVNANIVLISCCRSTVGTSIRVSSLLKMAFQNELMRICERTDLKKYKIDERPSYFFTIDETKLCRQMNDHDTLVD